MMTRTLVILVAAAFALGGCSVSEVINADETELVVANGEKAEARLLDVGIIEFDAGVPEDNNPEKTRIYGEIREAEARYLAYHLKNTMQGTGHWGAVRVLPSADAFTDVIVNARIKKSDGEFVELKIPHHIIAKRASQHTTRFGRSRSDRSPAARRPRGWRVKVRREHCVT